MRRPDHAPAGQGRAERWVAAAIGAAFVGIAIAILVFSPEIAGGALLASLVVGGLGIEALISAARNRRCLLSRIGPLP